MNTAVIRIDSGNIGTGVKGKYTIRSNIHIGHRSAVDIHSAFFIGDHIGRTAVNIERRIVDGFGKSAVIKDKLSFGVERSLRNTAGNIHFSLVDKGIGSCSADNIPISCLVTAILSISCTRYT